MLLIGTLAAMSCDSRTGDATVGPLLEPAAVKGNGIVQGRVVFIGTPPPRQVLRSEPCHESAEPIHDQTVVVGGDGSFQNVLVWLEGLPRVDGSGRDPAVLDQRNCQYVPHVLGVQIRQPLDVRSSDPTLHNVHYAPDKNRQGNLAFTGAGVQRRIAFDEAEVVRMRCDVHPWMNAYVGVFDNGFFAVTDADGAYRITGVPAGTYRLVAWQEQYGRQERSVTLGASPVEQNFEYRGQ
jgi:hypothetical protein